MKETRVHTIKGKLRKCCLLLFINCFLTFSHSTIFAQTCPVNLIEITSESPCADGQAFVQHFRRADVQGNDQPAFNANPDGVLNNNDDGFTLIDADGLPTFPSNKMPTTSGLRKLARLGTGVMNTTGNEDLIQVDGWLLVPPGVTTINFAYVNNDVVVSASAMYAGADAASMTQVATRLKNSSSPVANSSNAYTITAANPRVTLSNGCEWVLVRYRHYVYDQVLRFFANVTWDINGTVEQITSENLHSVTAPRLNDNIAPLSAQTRKAVRFAYQDSNNALFALDGAAGMTLNTCETSCIAQANANALNCMRPTTSQPLCQLTVVEVTPRTPTAGTGPYTQFLSGTNNDACNTGGITAGDMVAIRIGCFFNEFDPNTCLPTRSGMTVVPNVTTIGANDVAVGGNSTAGNDVDEGVQQDAWLMIPSGVSNIKFEIGGMPGIDYSALYLGKDYDDLKFVGQAETGPNAAPLPLEVNYGVPCDVQTASCGRRIIRLRHYTVDDGVGFNTIVQWDIGDGNGLVPIPTAAIYPATSSTDNVVPTIGFTNQATVEVIQDAKGDYYTARTGFGLPALGQCELAVETRFYPGECDLLKPLPDAEWCTSPLCQEIREVNASVCAPIPTMSEWGLIIFGLLTLNLGLIFLGRKRELDLI